MSRLRLRAQIFHSGDSRVEAGGAADAGGGDADSNGDGRTMPRKDRKRRTQESKVMEVRIVNEKTSASFRLPVPDLHASLHGLVESAPEFAGSKFKGADFECWCLFHSIPEVPDLRGTFVQDSWTAASVSAWRSLSKPPTEPVAVGARGAGSEVEERRFSFEARARSSAVGGGSDAKHDIILLAAMTADRAASRRAIGLDSESDGSASPLEAPRA